MAALVGVVLLVPRSAVIQTVVSSRSLIIGAAGCLLVGLVWIEVIIRTYLIGRPAGLDPGRRAIAALTVSCLCLLVAAPLGFGANLAISQRNLLDTLSAAATAAPRPPRPSPSRG